MTATEDECLTERLTEALTETIAEAWALHSLLLAVALLLGCAMRVGSRGAAAGIAGSFDFAVLNAANGVYVLSHAARIHDLATTIERSFLAAEPSPTPREVAAIFFQASRLAGACADAYKALLERLRSLKILGLAPIPPECNPDGSPSPAPPT